MQGAPRNSLPLLWHAALALMSACGIILLVVPMPVVPELGKLSARVPAAGWWKVLGVLVLAAPLTHWLVFALLRGVRWLFGLTELTDTARESLWPPALLGMCEAGLYPLALLAGHADFIGLWLLLKVAGQWPRWGLAANDSAKELDRGRRRYYHFMLGDAFMVFSGLVSYGVLKIVAL